MYCLREDKKRIAEGDFLFLGLAVREGAGADGELLC